MNGELTNFWRVLQNEGEFEIFKHFAAMQPFSQEAYDAACNRLISPIIVNNRPDTLAALSFFIRCRQLRAGSFKSFATLSRNRTRRGMNEQVSAWLNCINGLPAVHCRLKRVVILHDDALKVIRQQDGPKTLFYLDPPYVHSTRAKSATNAYEYEMTDNDHRKLAITVCECKGKVMLSGYRNKMYDEWFKSWNRHDKLIDNKLSSDRVPVIESVWANF